MRAAANKLPMLTKYVVVPLEKKKLEAEAAA
jgi:hypothetical protein